MRWIIAAFLSLLFAASTIAQDAPKVSDPRLVVELVAREPDIVHPIACDFDAKGRLLVVESHTHFAPQGYKGPKFDRIRMLDLKDGGKRFTTFFEGTRHTMDLAVHPDGSVYVATRSEIIRLGDTKGTGVADEKTRIVFLDTKGDYPHNGLSGLCFDSKGDLYFGMGENLGAKYTLVGADGSKFSGEGDGGHIFHCSADGKKLRRVATGFWNPFGICRDIYGRVFAVDNDPDQSPPCRMLHVVEGGDYGFRFCYGRSGKHPFQSWHGQLPGTLPMMTGVGEAPCEILSYESDGLPKEYLGQLLVTSWADHRVERYAVKPHGASFKGERLPFVQGGNNFRPTGMCVAPDGSLYVADWVLPNYTLHGKGALWHVRWKDDTSRERKRPADPKEAIFSLHRPLREAAARKLAADGEGRSFLHDQIQKGLVRTASAALTALIDTGGIKRQQLLEVAKIKTPFGFRELAVHELAARRELGTDVIIGKLPQRLRALAINGIDRIGKDLDVDHAETLYESLRSPDPFLRHAAIQRIAILRGFNVKRTKDHDLRLAMLLAERHRTGLTSRARQVDPYLNDPEETIRFLAVKWIADEKLADYRESIEMLMLDPKLSVRMYTACATAIARLDGKNVNEKSLADYFAQRLADDATPPALRAQLLRQVPATHKLLTVDLLSRLVKSNDGALKLEAVRALVEHPSTKRQAILLDVFRNPKLALPLRGMALVGLDDKEKPIREELLALANDEKSPLRNDALRALNKERAIAKDRPPAKDIDAWRKRLEGLADADAGARIFFHPRLTGCAKCHRIDGRGADVGPDLSSIGRTDRRHILESILQPSNTVAPHYQAWLLEMVDGRVLTGTLLHTQLDEYTYLDANGKQFKVKTGDIAEARAAPVSIMPDGLVDRLTDQEIRDLLAYLGERK